MPWHTIDKIETFPASLQLLRYNRGRFVMRKFFGQVTKILASKGLFIFTLCYFVFQAVWIALSAVYPQAFDEGFHFGIIKIYATHWSPFLTKQPVGGDPYGALARDPSYLYHYLMSFPYRFFALFTHDQTSLVIGLRLIDVVFFTIGLVLFRKLLLRARISRALTNVMMLVFTLIPIVPQLAAHINYDDLLMPLTAWTCLMTLGVVDEIRAHKPNIRHIAILASVGLLTSIVKYAYLPIFAAIVLYVLFVVVRRNHSKNDWKQFFRHLGGSWLKQSLVVKILLVVALVISFGMFFQRDGLNLIDYHTITPDCSKILPNSACNQYSVWHADNVWHTELLKDEAVGKNVGFENPIVYFASWLYWLWYRLFFAVSGPNSNYTNYPPLPLPSAAAVVLAVAGTILAIIWRHRIFRDQYLGFFLLASFLYLAALFVSGWQDYHYTNILVDMNGRYLLPVLLLLGAIIARAFSIALRHASTMRKTALAFAILILFFEGGGFLTFLSRSDASWDWPNNTVVKANDAARDVTKPIILHTGKSYSTKYWFFN